MPMIPLGESLPPTMLKPRLFLPGPFSNTMVWKVPLPIAAFTTDDAALRSAPAPALFLGFLQGQRTTLTRKGDEGFSQVAVFMQLKEADGLDS